MNACKPFGDIDKAKILVIGHDPRLQRSDAQASYSFFLDYLGRLPPTRTSERRKYEFASSTVSYIQHLGGPGVLLEDMFFTNLCNGFLGRPIGRGTVLITDNAADRGIQDIEDILARGSLELILPMAPQVFYHLVRTGFVTDSNENLRDFLMRAQPRSTAKERKAYEPIGRSPFLLVCGRMYSHRRDYIPIIPIVHAKQWPLNSKMEPHYGLLMIMAATNAQALLRNPTSRNGLVE